MTIPSNVMGAGTPALTTRAICGGAATGLTASGSSSQANAFQLSASFNEVTTAAANSGVKLPAIEEGCYICISLASGQSTMTVYPHETSGVTINAAASVTIATNKRAIFWAVSNTAWYFLLGA